MTRTTKREADANPLGRPGGVPCAYDDGPGAGSTARIDWPHRRAIPGGHGGGAGGRLRPRHRSVPRHFGEPPGPGARAARTGPRVLSQRARRPGAKAFRGRAGRWGAEARSCQHPAIPGRHAGSQAIDRLLRCSGRARLKPQCRVGKRDHLHRHGVWPPAVYPRGRRRRRVGLRPGGVGRGRVPAASERAVAAARRFRPGGAGVSGRRLRPTLCRGARGTALAGQPPGRS